MSASSASKPSWSFTGVAGRIKERRLELELSQRAMADPSNHVTYAYISRIESGARQPSLDALITLARRLQTSALYLLTGDADADCPLCGRSDANTRTHFNRVDAIEMVVTTNSPDVVAAIEKVIARNGGSVD